MGHSRVLRISARDPNLGRFFFASFFALLLEGLGERVGCGLVTEMLVRARRKEKEREVQVWLEKVSPSKIERVEWG